MQHQTARIYTNEHGESVKTMAHRAGWDATFSAPKSVSLTALVGGDERVREAHRESVAVALDEAERYVQARIGRNHPAETTGQWVAATFEHDSARPVDGYAAPQLHTHVVFFNVTETRERRDPRAATAGALQEPALCDRRVPLGARHAPDRAWATRSSAGAADSPRFAATRRSTWRPPVRAASRLKTTSHRSSSTARRRRRSPRTRRARRSSTSPMRRCSAGIRRWPRRSATSRPAWSRPRTSERGGLEQQRVGRSRRTRPSPTRRNEISSGRRWSTSERCWRDALRRSMGEVPVGAIQAEFERRVDDRGVHRGGPVAWRSRPRLHHARDDRARARDDRADAGGAARPARARRWRHAPRDRARLCAPERAPARGRPAHPGQPRPGPGAGGRRRRGEDHRVGGGPRWRPSARATVSKGSRRPHAPRRSWARPASRRARCSGIWRAARSHATDSPRLYVLDESSLASTRQMHAFLHRLDPQDRVLLVGDVRQHQAVEAGRPYQQLQEAGIETVRLDDIVRQQDPGPQARRRAPLARRGAGRDRAPRGAGPRP